ncbi:hypothetical protein CIB95_05810 [Lottiidibacillus patelloidae]|uniref:Uncharacterized protein n=1 Tax=Lottiidibacillus patelloidae TaxID=2670334 RepID=A0A263BVU1_9BACI|nr:prepilin-type N-terminal cleavage/methylation domain-containing protein [Lottiidibacillus patelloidae]OZM57871.1 hypothetical protein CIB95_05810 [Lottiidibacillus patelloidae]
MVEHNNKNGFTLLEVLVSFTLLSIVILIFFSAFQRYALVSNINEDNLVAMNLAKKVTVGMEKNTNEILEKYGDFYDENAYLDINNEIENNFLNVEILEQLEINNIPYYKVMSGDQVFFISIKNITADNNKVTEHATINVEVLDSRLTKVVAENFGYISTIASNEEGGNTTNETTYEPDPLAEDLAGIVLTNMKNKKDKIENNYLSKTTDSTFFDTSNTNHVASNQNHQFDFYNNKENIANCPEENTCYKDTHSDQTYIFTIENVTENPSSSPYTIEVRVYNLQYEEVAVKTDTITN